MKPEQFFQYVRELAARVAPSAKVQVVTERSHAGGMGADVVIDFGGLLVRATMDRGQYWFHVATPEDPAAWFELLHVLQLVAKEPPERAKVLVGNALADLDAPFRRLVENQPAVRDAFSKERLEETRRELAWRKRETMSPLLRAQFDRVKKPPT